MVRFFFCVFYISPGCLFIYWDLATTLLRCYVFQFFNLNVAAQKHNTVSFIVASDVWNTELHLPVSSVLEKSFVLYPVTSQRCIFSRLLFDVWRMNIWAAVNHSSCMTRSWLLTLSCVIFQKSWVLACSSCFCVLFQNDIWNRRCPWG